MSNGKQQLINIMVDIETTATCHNAGILTIGATVISDKLNLEPDFYQKIRWDLLEQNGYIIDPDTMSWWNKPHNVIARAEAFSGTNNMPEVLGNFNYWLRTVAPLGFNLWSKPASFDLSLIKDAMDKSGIVPCWTHQEERCFRTLEKTLHWIKRPTFIGTAHNALADAKNQAAHLATILQYIEQGRVDCDFIRNDDGLPG